MFEKNNNRFYLTNILYFLIRRLSCFSGTSDTGYDLIFMLDGTANNRVFNWMKNFVRNYASQLPVDSGQYRVGAMTYTNRPNGQFQLNQYNTQNEVSVTGSLRPFFHLKDAAL